MDLYHSYRPARICDATRPNSHHVCEPTFSDEQLGMPPAPVKPVLMEVVHWLWMPSIISIILFFLLFPPSTSFIAILGLVITWLWAFTGLRSEYHSQKEEANKKYRQAIVIYEKDISYYNAIQLPEWREKQRPIALKEKYREWQRNAIDQACRRKGWRVHSTLEVEETRNQGFVGPGEDDLVDALNAAGISTRHQVSIKTYYTADIVCFNLSSGKLCVVEVDGSQHWSKPEQIERDQQRMDDLALMGVPTIRFINRYAQSNPRQCARTVQDLLK